MRVCHARRWSSPRALSGRLTGALPASTGAARHRIGALCAVIALLGTTGAAAAPPAAMRIAVLEFVSASSDSGLEALGKGLQAMVTTDLSKVGALALVERARLSAIVEEQKLGRSGLIDAHTAAKIGKLAGASHLLGGTFTVHAGQMRIDARLVAVDGGDVLLADEITGERDAFFELEKALVRKLVRTLGVTLVPKERAGMARIHTADFEAFARYSQGVAHFDAKRYDKAMEALRAAMALDADFSLARVTLEDYEGVVATIRSKASQIALSQRELKRLEADAVAQRDAAVVQRLAEIAGEGGDAHRLRRMAALVYLMGFYNPKARNHGRISRFQDRYDGLDNRSRLGGLARRYLVESQAIFPKAPLFAVGRHPPEDLAEVDAKITTMSKLLSQGYAHRAEHTTRGLVKNLGQVDAFIDALTADMRERIALYELALDKARALQAEPRLRARLLTGLADLWVSVGDVDAASGVLAHKSTLLDRSSELERVATQIAALREPSELLSKTDRAAALKELIGDRNGRLSDRQTALFAARGPASSALLYALYQQRRPTRWWTHKDPYWFFGDEPARLIAGEYGLSLGPRVDRLHSDRLDYYRATEQSGPDILVALGRGPRTAFTASFEVHTVPPADYRPLRPARDAAPDAPLALDAGQPELSFVFGLRDVDTDSVREAGTGKAVYPRPTRAYAVRIGSGGCRLDRLGELGPAHNIRLPVMTRTELARKGRGLRRAWARVSVTVKGRKVTVEIDGEQAHFVLPSADAAAGFLGFHVRGSGYVGVRTLTVKDR